MPKESHTPPTLYVMVGLPGAGKTTGARKIETEHRALRLTPDDWMKPLFGDSMADGKRNVLEGRLIATGLQALRLGVDVVLDFGVWARVERMALRWVASTVAARFELVYIPVDPVEQTKRIAQRFASAPETTFLITDADLAEYRTIFQVPDEDELTATLIDAPPLGSETWAAWVADWWPTSLLR